MNTASSQCPTCVQSLNQATGNKNNNNIMLHVIPLPVCATTAAVVGPLLCVRACVPSCLPCIDCGNMPSDWGVETAGDLTNLTKTAPDVALDAYGNFVAAVYNTTIGYELWNARPRISGGAGGGDYPPYHTRCSPPKILLPYVAADLCNMLPCFREAVILSQEFPHTAVQKVSSKPAARSPYFVLFQYMLYRVYTSIYTSKYMSCVSGCV